MSVTLHFDYSEALDKGVHFKSVEGEIFVGDEMTDDIHNPNKYVMGEIGETVICPDGSKGFSMLNGMFQCKNINQEIKKWFIENIKSSHISY